jgi:hypothetical protein
MQGPVHQRLVPSHQSRPGEAAESGLDRRQPE